MTVTTVPVSLTPQFDSPQPSIKGELLPMAVRNGRKSFTIETYAVDARQDHNRKIVVFPPWAGRFGNVVGGKQMELKAIAEATQSYVLGVDNLGIGHRTSGLTPGMFGRLAGGDWSEVTSLMWDAIEQHPTFELDNTNDLALGWCSLATSVASEMAAHAPEGVRVNRLVLYDPVVSRARTFGQLALNVARYGTEELDTYQAETKRLGWDGIEYRNNPEYARDIARKWMGHLGCVMAMAKRPLRKPLIEARDRGTLTAESEVWLMNGSKSKVSTTPENDELAQELEEHGLYILRRELQGATHALGDSIPLIEALMREVYAAYGPDGDHLHNAA